MRKTISEYANIDTMSTYVNRWLVEFSELEKFLNLDNPNSLLFLLEKKISLNPQLSISAVIESLPDTAENQNLKLWWNDCVMPALNAMHREISQIDFFGLTALFNTTKRSLPRVVCEFLLRLQDCPAVLREIGPTMLKTIFSLLIRIDRDSQERLEQSKIEKMHSKMLSSLYYLEEDAQDLLQTIFQLGNIRIYHTFIAEVEIAVKNNHLENHTFNAILLRAQNIKSTGYDIFSIPPLLAREHFNYLIKR